MIFAFAVKGIAASGRLWCADAGERVKTGGLFLLKGEDFMPQRCLFSTPLNSAAIFAFLSLRDASMRLCARYAILGSACVMQT